MPFIPSRDRCRFLVNRLRERLWVKPLAICLISILCALAARLADHSGLGHYLPVITNEALLSLLSIMSASMLGIATFAVASMVAAYASASSAATPRSVTLVIADDVSQNALSTFIGAFIFSVVALIGVKNDYFALAGRFTLFLLTLIVLAIVILMFVHWVDRIARLGRLGTTVKRVEQATHAALQRRRQTPTLRARPADEALIGGLLISSPEIGYVQQIDVAYLNALAAEMDTHIQILALPGTFVAPGQGVALAYGCPDPTRLDLSRLATAFKVGAERLFDEDPRFGLIVLAEIAGRALSPAVNDPGTAIGILATLVRLFVNWDAPLSSDEQANNEASLCDRVTAPPLAVIDMFDDAFTAIARDGAGTLEVALRLQKALQALTHGSQAMSDAAHHHGRLALARCELTMTLEEDKVQVRALARALLGNDERGTSPGSTLGTHSS
jgi:uncharacterized membrane protein